MNQTCQGGTSAGQPGGGRFPIPGQIALFTDFGQDGPYLGQVEAVLHTAGVRQPIIRLMSDVPAYNPRAAAYLLRSLADRLPAPVLFLAVIDPGVGGDRHPLVVTDGRHCFIGPDNGLFSQVLCAAERPEAWVIGWRPESCSVSFHGRDLFAPVAAMIARGRPVPSRTTPPESLVGADWPGALYQVIYLDHYGNAYTGICADELDTSLRLRVKGHTLTYARTFSDCPKGTPFWYKNSLGLVEIAVAEGRADKRLGVRVGDQVEIDRTA